MHYQDRILCRSPKGNGHEITQKKAFFLAYFLFRNFIEIINKVEMEMKLPETLVKYYECNENSIDALENNYLWAANPMDFNDPFDCYKFAWEEDSFTEEIIKHYSEFEGEITIEIKLLILENLIRGIGIICLNEHSGNEDLFWGLYSKQQGFAIEFNQIKLTKDFSKAIPIEVTYDKLKTYRLTSDRKLLEEQIKDWMSHKKNCWEKENEWRYILSSSCNLTNENRKKYYSSGAVSTVTLGFKFFEKRFLTKTDSGYSYDLYASNDILKYQIIRSLINKGYSLQWIHLNNSEFKVAAIPIKLEFINPFEINIITKE